MSVGSLYSALMPPIFVYCWTPSRSYRSDIISEAFKCDMRTSSGHILASWVGLRTSWKSIFAAIGYQTDGRQEYGFGAINPYDTVDLPGLVFAISHPLLIELRQ